MKKLIVLLIGIFYLVSYADAQIIRFGELEEYAKEHYGETWKKAAKNLKDELVLDENRALTYDQIIESPGKSASELYILLNYWFVSTFNDGNSVVQLSDKELGVIMAAGYLPNIARNVGGMSNYTVSINPVIRIDIKDERVKITCTIPYYSVEEVYGDGWFSALDKDDVRRYYSHRWAIDNCYPFKNKDERKKTSSKALVMSHAYANVIMDRIEKVIHTGAVGSESQDW